VDKGGNIYTAFADNNTPRWYASVMKFSNPEVSIKENAENDKRLRVFPNPSSGKMSISFQGNGTSPTEIRLINQQGQVVYTKTYDCDEPDSYRVCETLDISAYAKGFYFLTINSGELREVEKIVIE
jgi:hypothetical protein